VRSLFVVGLPRTLSSLVYQVARRALGLSEPAWTTDGEILNQDRFVFYDGARHDESHKFTHPEIDPDRFARIAAFLDHVVRAEGHAYKDVVHPFVVARWLAGRDFAVLRIERPLADVAFAMRHRGWRYPRRASARRGDEAVLEGLVRAQAALAGLRGETLAYDELIWNEEVLRGALARLYPDTALGPVAYIDAAFVERRERVLLDRQTTEYRALGRDLASLRDHA